MTKNKKASSTNTSIFKSVIINFSIMILLILGVIQFVPTTDQSQIIKSQLSSSTNLPDNINIMAGGFHSAIATSIPQIPICVFMNGSNIIVGNLTGGATGGDYMSIDPSDFESIIAGTGASGFSGDGGPALNAEIGYPVCGFVDNYGNIIFADSSNYRYRVVAGTTGEFYGQSMIKGDIYTIAGNGTWGDMVVNGSSPLSAEFRHPIGARMDSYGNLLLYSLGHIRVVPSISGTYYGQTMTAGDIYTIAGNGTQGYNGNGIPAIDAEFGGITSVTIDKNNNLVVADDGNQIIRVIAGSTGTFYGQTMTAGDVYTIAGNGTAGYNGDSIPAISAELNYPASIAFDDSSNLILTDQFNNRVRVIAESTGTFYGRPMTTGDIYTIAGNGVKANSGDGGSATNAELSHPFSLTFDSYGNIVITTYTNTTYNGSTIRLLAESTGTFYGQSMTAGNIYTIAGYGAVNYPDAIPISSCECGPSPVGFDQYGNFVVKLLYWPGLWIGVIANSTGTFYGRSMIKGDIYTIAVGQQGTSTSNGIPAIDAQYNALNIILDSNGNIILGDSNSNTIKVIAETTGNYYGQSMTAGDIYIIAGTGTSGYSPSGTLALVAALNQPSPDSVDKYGNLIFSDQSSNNLVRVLAESTGTFYGQSMIAGYIYTIAGDGVNGVTGDGGPAVNAELSGSYAIVDSLGNVLIDTQNAIRVVAESTGIQYGQSMTAGDIYTIAGTGSSGYATGVPALNSPINDVRIIMDPNGNIVIETYQHIMVIATSTGTFYGQSMTKDYLYTIGGAATTDTTTGGSFSGMDGPAPDANFGVPAIAIAIDQSGNIYFGFPDLLEMSPPPIPNPPTNAVATPLNSSVLLSWSAPIDVHGYPIAGYIIYPYDNGVALPPIYTNSNSTSYDIVSLTNGNSYTFSVAAVNAVGESVESSPSAAVIPSTVSDPPTNVTATASNQSASISWTPPTNDGGLSLTGYSISVNNLTTSTVTTILIGSTVTNTTVNSLTAGDSYQFSIDAINPNGSSSLVNSNTVIPYTVSYPPTNVIATASNQSATITWSLPTSNGGSNITDYLIEVSGANTIDTKSTSLTYAATGLNNGQTYVFSVIAVNAAGDSNPSNMSNAVVPATTSSSPTNVVAVPLDSSANLSWSPPTSTGGYPIISYQITSNPTTTTINVSGSSTSTVITGLTNGTFYSFSIIAINQVGLSTATVSNSITPIGPPGVPANVTAMASNGSVNLSWSDISSASNPISSYTITSNPGNIVTTVSGTSTSTTITGLTNGTSYSFSIVANNQLSDSAPGISNTVVPTSGDPTTLINPIRILDTRANSGYTGQGSTLGPNSFYTLSLPSVVPNNATAVMLNVTVTNTTTSGFLSVVPGKSSAIPTTSNINWTMGQTIANMAEVPVVNSQITFYNFNGNTDLIVDLEGYTAPPIQPGYGLYNPINPIRVADTRVNSMNAYSGKTLTPGSSITIQVTGASQIPTSGLLGVIANLTVTNTTAPGYLIAWNGLGQAPNTSVINWASGQTIANRVALYLSPSGSITFYNPFGNTDITLDIVGYFTDGSNVNATGYSYNPITTPIRLVDTRATSNNLYQGKTLTSANESLQVNITNSTLIPSDAKAITANLTVTNTSDWSFLTVWPANLTNEPNTSDLNWTGANQSVANFGDFLVGEGSKSPPNGYINISNAFGQTDVILDVFGYYS